jgi:hypothetical protein
MTGGISHGQAMRSTRASGVVTRGISSAFRGYVPDLIGM